MSVLRHCSCLLVIVVAVSANIEYRVAVATLTPRVASSDQDIFGTIVFTETDSGLHITGSIAGLPAGSYGFHVHELGDISTCDASGSHFNPENTNHGGRNHTVRHVGDLGNVVFVDNGTEENNGVASINIVDNILTLRGSNNIIGRTLVLHAQEDDLGLGGHETSLTTGNAGPRVACGVIGLRSPVDSWNSGVINSPSLIVFTVATLLTCIRNVI